MITLEQLAAELRTSGGDSAARAFSAGVEAVVVDVASADAWPKGCAVLALGGLARRQLLPFSDVDLLFLVDGAAGGAGGAIDVGAIVSRLWDRGLKVSWSVRAPGELLGLFSDVVGKQGHAAMAVLEARPIAGDVASARATLRDLRRESGSRRRQALIEARVDEALARRARFHGSPSLVEPDLKDGPGGLRDVQLLGWAGLCRSGADVGDDDVLDVLLRAGALFPSEVSVLRAARSELLTLRAALVCGAGRNEPRLHADAAEKAAAVLAPRVVANDDDDDDGEDDGDDVMGALGASSGALATPQATPPPTAGSLRPGEEVVRRAVVAMRQVLVVVDDALVRFTPDRAPRRARNEAPSLMTLLSATEPVFPGAFTGLLERGQLQPLLPDLQRLTGRVKHDGIHAFTTDAHLARCGDIAAAIVAGAGPSVLHELALPEPLQPILARCARPAVVVASALLHDIGKGLPGDHSVIGERIARSVLGKAGCADDDVDDVSFLVLHHLELSTTAQRRDLGDPRVVDEIKDLVRTPERLDALALLTWCDWCAVGPGVGTLWKAKLLRTCVDVVREALLSPETRARADDDVKKKARDLLPDTKSSRAFVDGASVAFLRGRSAEELLADAAAWATERTAVVDASSSPQQPSQRAWVRCADRPGLLADLAAAFASEGASVLDARLDVRADGGAFDAFAFDDGRGRPLPDETADRIAAALVAAAAGQVRPVSRTKPVSSVPPRVRFLDEAGSASAGVVVEVRGADRRGLLHDLARVFADHQLSITVARLHTEGARVTDVFTAHRTDRAAGQAAVDAAARHGLEASLLRVLEVEPRGARRA